MNLALQHEESTRWSHGMLYGMLLLAVPVSLPLGMASAAIGAWFAIQAGSPIFLPAGLVILLAALAVLRSRSVADFVFLVLALLALIGWSNSGHDARNWVQNSVAELSGRVDVLMGLLAIMVAALLSILWYRHVSVPPGDFVR